MANSHEVGWTTEDVLIPAFQLSSTEGRALGPGNFKQRRNLILVFLHRAECTSCRALLNTLARNYPNFRSLNAQILVIVGGEKKAAEDLHHRMRLTFPFLFDPEDRVAPLCLVAGSTLRPAMLVADRYGALWAGIVPEKEDGTIEVREALEWLEFIEIQCPECDVPDQPPPSQSVLLRTKYRST